MDWRIPAIILVMLVAAAIFVVVLRSNRARNERDRDQAIARGETVRKAPNLTVIYFVVGGLFLVVGALMLGLGR